MSILSSQKASESQLIQWEATLGRAWNRTCDRSVNYWEKKIYKTIFLLKIEGCVSQVTRVSFQLKGPPLSGNSQVRESNHLEQVTQPLLVHAAGTSIGRH